MSNITTVTIPKQKMKLPMVRRKTKKKKVRKELMMRKTTTMKELRMKRVPLIKRVPKKESQKLPPENSGPKQ